MTTHAERPSPERPAYTQTGWGQGWWWILLVLLLMGLTIWWFASAWWWGTSQPLQSVTPVPMPSPVQTAAPVRATGVEAAPSTQPAR